MRASSSQSNVSLAFSDKVSSSNLSQTDAGKKFSISKKVCKGCGPVGVDAEAQLARAWHSSLRSSGGHGRVLIFSKISVASEIATSEHRNFACSWALCAFISSKLSLDEAAAAA